MEALMHVRQQEIHGPQSEDGEDVGSQDDERVRGDGEDGGDRIDSKNKVGEFINADNSVLSKAAFESLIKQ